MTGIRRYLEHRPGPRSTERSILIDPIAAGTGSALNGINLDTSDDESQSKGEVQYEDEDRLEQRLHCKVDCCDMQRYDRLQLLLHSGAAPVVQQVNITL